MVVIRGRVSSVRVRCIVCSLNVHYRVGWSCTREKKKLMYVASLEKFRCFYAEETDIRSEEKRKKGREGEKNGVVKKGWGV